MESKTISPAPTGTNKLKLGMRDSAQFQFSHMNLFGDDFKKIQTGLGFGFFTTCRKSIDVENTSIIIRPSQANVYLYFKCPTNGSKATLISSDIELFDTEDSYLKAIPKSMCPNQAKQVRPK